MSRILFGSIATLILITLSYFTAKMYALGMRFEVVATRLTFFIFLLVPLLFAVSMVLAQTGNIGATLYREIQLLAGIGFYVTLGAIVLMLCLIVAYISKSSLPTGVAWSIFFLSLAFAGIGFIQSRFIKTVRYTVTLDGAPASWNGKTAALVSDTHFGLINHKQFSNKVVDALLALHPDFVLHAGDFYDGPAIDTLPMTASWKRLVSQIPVFYAPGNHEEYGNYAGFLDSIRNAGVTILDDKKTVYDGVQIAGITYRAGKDNPDATTAITSLELSPEMPSILINHPPTAFAAAHEAGIDLQVSGHTHNGQFWPMTYLVRKIYGQYYYGLKTYEDMQIITSSGIGTFGPPFRLFNPPEIVLITFQMK